jgi:hypothetical protein
MNNPDSLFLSTILTSRILPLVFAALTLLTCFSCDDSTSPDEPISITITQPADSQTVSGTLLRILTITSSQCGCNAHVEFFIDGVHVYSHYQPFYYFDWNIMGLSGEHVIRTRLVVVDKGEANDSVRVFIEK